MIVSPKMREETRHEIAKACKTLYLSRQVLHLCDAVATPKQEAFLLQVLQAEVASREQNKITKLLNKAQFPTLKHFDNYEFDGVKCPPTLSQEGLVTVDFISEKKNLVLYGPVGTGKTHLAIAVGLQAVQLGLRVKFYAVTSLVLKLEEAKKNGTLEKLVGDLQNLDLLILDEWGYVPIDKESAQLLFRVVADSYECKSLILTTNLEFSKWGGIFTDEQMAAAMIDRLVHHGHLILFEGQSYRMKHALMRKTSRNTAAFEGSDEGRSAGPN